MLKEGGWMKKTRKIIILFIIIFLAISTFNLCYSADVKFSADTYKPSDLTNDDTKVAFDKAGIILGAIRNISVVVSVISLMVIGIKYMLGSVEEKANYKQTMIPYIIGCVLAAGGTTIVTYIYNAVK